MAGGGQCLAVVNTVTEVGWGERFIDELNYDQLLKKDCAPWCWGMALPVYAEGF